MTNPYTFTPSFNITEKSVTDFLQRNTLLESVNFCFNKKQGAVLKTDFHDEYVCS